MNKTTPALCHVYGQCDQLKDELEPELEHLEQLDILADITVPLRIPDNVRPRLRRWAVVRGLVAPSIYPVDLDPACINSNWWNYDEATCIRLLTVAKAIWMDQGFERLEAITTYTPGNALIAACRKVGIEYILGFCAPIVINDGHWQITHVGSPLGPYLAGEEDFRKPGLAHRHVVVASMELRNPLTCLEHWSEGPFGPLNLIMGDRTIEVGEYPVETMAACEDWIRLSELTGQWRFFQIDLQWFTSRRCTDLNRCCLAWLKRQGEVGRLRFTTLREYRQELIAGEGVARQTTWWRGSCMGQTLGGQPAGGVEGIVHENNSGQWQFRRGEAGAARHYDYTSVWSFPAFDPTGTLPAYAQQRMDIQRLTQRDLSANVCEVSFAWSSDSPGLACIWEACRGLSAPFHLVDAGGMSVEVVPHPGGIDGALLVALPVAQGSAIITVRHQGRATQRQTRSLAGLATMQTILLDGRPITRIAPDVPSRVNLPISASVEHDVRWELLRGGTLTQGVLASGRTVMMELDGAVAASVLRLWDVWADEVMVPPEAVEHEFRRLTAAAQETAGSLAPTCAKPAQPLRFTRETEIPDWARLAARAAADREIARLHPLAVARGKSLPLASGHLACDLPFGTKGRARSQRYDRWESAATEGFFAIYYDYGYCACPGVSGWAQFWQINLGLRGLVPGKPYRIILHMTDPECRGTIVRILGKACDNHGYAIPGRQPLLLKPRFQVAQGCDARFGDAAFVTVDLPGDLPSEIGAVDIAIRSHSEDVQYDRRAEGYGFIFLSHAWLFPLQDAIV